jgi:lipoic acid synthetase
VAEGIRRLRLSHVVITSPTRDDLDDGGAAAFSATVAEIRAAAPSTAIELLVPDFMAKEASIATVVASGPDIFGHNIETVPRLYEIRSGAEYHRSLEVLALVKGFVAGMPTKSGIMVGLGETVQEVLQVLKDLRRVKCDYVSIGQYLAPSRRHHNVVEYVEPALFERYHQEALALGFKHVESGPYVRSSYHAGEYGRTQAETAR